MNAPADSRADGFFLGWLDAAWLAFASNQPLNMPPDIRRGLVRRGWFKPVSYGKDGHHEITPAGAQAVIAMNEAAGIDRRVIDGETEEQA